MAAGLGSGASSTRPGRRRAGSREAASTRRLGLRPSRAARVAVIGPPRASPRRHARSGSASTARHPDRRASCSGRIRCATSTSSPGAYDAPALGGPSSFFPHDVPDTKLEPIYPGRELPGGLVALYDGRGRNETPLWLPEQRALVFADALTAPGGELRVWATPWHEERALPALRRLLELPFELVIVSHGEPVHDRAAFERALELRPWAG